MTSAILSPHTSALPISDVPLSRRRHKPACFSREPHQISASPDPTTVSTATTRSIRSQRRQSRSLSGPDPSPEKSSVSSKGSRKGKEKAVILPQMIDTDKVDAELLEEGDPELDIDISDTITVNGHDSSTASEKPDVEGPPREDPVIRLTVGKKRKSPVKDEETAGVEKQEMDDDVKGDGSKRAPRKKRKWLKKGEVDPDDPIAVAKQKKRHEIIDEALASLDRQLEMIKEGTHPQLMWMLSELEARRKKQLSKLDARFQADTSDLLHMHDHDASQAMFNWKMYCEEFMRRQTLEDRRKARQLQQEKTSLKRDPKAMPNLRDGSGGGGWAFYDGSLLSTGEQKLAPIKVDGRDCQRRAVSLTPRGLDEEDFLDDLFRLGLGRKRKNAPKTPSPPPPHRATAYIPLSEHYRTWLPPSWATNPTTSNRRYENYNMPPRHDAPLPKRAEHHIETRHDHRQTPLQSQEYQLPPAASYWYHSPGNAQDQPAEREREMQKEKEKERRRAAFPPPPLPASSRQRYEYWAAPHAPPNPARSRNDLVIPPFNPMKAGREMPPPPTLSRGKI